MEKKNQYMEVAYQLFVDGEQGQEMMEEATKERPFQFITGFGVALDVFEQQVVGLQKGDSFDYHNLKVSVEDIQHNRILKVRIVQLPVQDEDGEEKDD